MEVLVAALRAKSIVALDRFAERRSRQINLLSELFDRPGLFDPTRRKPRIPPDDPSQETWVGDQPSREMQRLSSRGVALVERLADVEGILADEALAMPVHQDRTGIQVERRRHAVAITLVPDRQQWIDQGLVHMRERGAERLRQAQRIALIGSRAGDTVGWAGEMAGQALGIPFEAAA